MDGLSKDQKDEMAVSLASMIVYDGGAELNAENIAKIIEAAGSSDHRRSSLQCSHLASPVHQVSRTVSHTGP